eukprot:TRINITY_DN26769_c0_g1_i1.p1 TRINITY_DN26769_c0_g1~~TRINITY_DN26769_c0_g1_i1.p1  ORF type:complete len:322 (+),score=82.86 TRINITY_DN26769_c0_g1_i1:70-1035(+)
MGGPRRRARSSERPIDPWLPISPGRWAEQIREGAPHSFCSACGSRAVHKQQLEDTFASLSKQVAILREITRRQEEDVVTFTADKEQVLAQLALRAAARPGVEGSAADHPRWQLSSDLTLERAEVERLRAELGVWRRDAEVERQQAEVSARSGFRSDEDPLGALRREEEAKKWKADRDSLRNALEEAQQKVRQLLSAKMQPREAFVAAFPELETARLEEEADRDRRRAASLRQRTAALRQEAEEEARAAEARQGELAEDISLAERRLKVEVELRHAQQAQLESLRDTIAAVRSQLQYAKRENIELKQSLSQNKEVLRRHVSK